MRLLALAARPLAALAAAIALFLVTASACGRGGPGRVIVLGMDGLDPRAVDLLIS